MQSVLFPRRLVLELMADCRSPCSRFARLAATAKWTLVTYQMIIFCELLTDDAFCMLQGHGVILGGYC